MRISGRALLICAAALGMQLLGTAAWGGELKDEFYQDFRSVKYPPTSILSIADGEGQQKTVNREAGGVHIFVSGKPSGFPPFGVSPRFHVSGDFEITLSFDVLKLDKPKTGYGVSATLWVMADVPSVDAVTLSRSNRPWDGDVWVADKGWWDVAAKKYEHDGQSFPTKCKSGKLRLVRTGSIVSCQVAEGDSDEFQEVRQINYRTEDLAQIHLGVDTGGSNGPAEVMLKDLRIRAEDLPLAGATRKQTKRAWLIWLLAALGGLAAAVAVGAWFLWRRHIRLKKAVTVPEKAPLPRPRKSLT